MPSLQESVPGQETTSLIWSAPASPSPSSLEPLPDVVDRLVAHPAQQEVLVHGGAGVAAAELAHDLREAAELLRREVAAGDLDLDGREALLALRLDVGRAEARERGAVAVGRAVGVRHARARRPARRRGTRGPRSRSRARRPSRPRAPRRPSARTSSMPTLSTSTLMRARARLTRSQSWRSKMRRTASAHLRYSPSSAVTNSFSVGATRGMIDVPPPTRSSKPLTPSRSRAMNAMSWMPVSARSASAPREGGLDLARHQLRRGVAHEVAHVRARVGRRVEQLVGADAGPRVGGHVAHRVAAALAAGEPGLGDLADERGRVAQRDVVDLDVLARRDVALVERRELLDRAREGVHLRRARCRPTGA